MDDIAILMLFLAQNATFCPQHIVVGQYLGFTALILASLPGFFWCYTAYKLTQQGAIADVLTRYINYLVPVVLIGLGAFIVLESGALSLLKLVASCLCLMILVKNDSSISN